jgi:hypothetical protein
MRFRCLAATAALLLLPSVALAQEECPDGDWFCENPAEASDQGDAASERPDGAPQERSKPDADKEGSVVVYTPKGSKPPSKVIVVEKPPPKPAKPRKIREWGFNLHLSGALMGDGADEHDAEMGGLGFAFRYRPVRMLAIDAGLEMIGGTDWNGFDRRETAFLANCLLYLNPRDKVQVFWFGGFGFSGAKVQVETAEDSFEERYSYFGLQTGIGIEGRISRKVALGADLLGFVRGRSDARPNSRPEFVDEETHRATNASGGGLIRGGVTFYW